MLERIFKITLSPDEETESGFMAGRRWARTLKRVELAEWKTGRRRWYRFQQEHGGNGGVWGIGMR